MFSFNIYTSALCVKEVANMTSDVAVGPAGD